MKQSRLFSNVHVNEKLMKQQKHDTIDCILKTTFYFLHSTSFDNAMIYANFYRETFHFITLLNTITRKK